MQCTLLIPRLFWPRDSVEQASQALSLPSLATFLARADVARCPALTPEAWLCQAFEVERQQDWPVAALTFGLDGGELDSAYYLRADPVHIKIGSEGLHLVNSALFDVTAHEAQALVAALNGHFGDEGIRFFAAHAKRWYAKLDRRPQLVTHSLGEVAGKSVHALLPTGADASAWRGTFNQAQMVLHDHPVNQAREASGAPEINSVWFWGGGVVPDVPGRLFDAVWADDAFATALATAAARYSARVPHSGAEWQRAAAGERLESHLIMLDSISTAVTYDDRDAWRTRIAELDTGWVGPLLTALRQGRMTRLTLVTLGEQESCRFTLTRADLLKLWRRPQPLSAYA